MPERLVVVESVFEVPGYRTIALPSLEGHPKPGAVRVELRHPDGTREIVDGRIVLEHLNPGGFKHTLHFSIPKARIPAGTEIWTVDGMEH